MQSGTSHDLPWDALYVRARFERIVTAHLDKRGVQNYLPLRTINRASGSRLQSIEIPLFPGYVFCKRANRNDWSCLTIPGVLAAIHPTHGIASISDADVRNLQRILGVGNVKSWPFRPEGVRAMLRNGPLRSLTGILEHRSQKRHLVFSIPLIQRSFAIEVERDCTLAFVDDSLPSAV